LPRWRGTEFKAGDILFHSRGDRLHQTTSGPSRWSLITFDPVELDIYARALFDTPLPAPEEGRVLRPSGRDAARLRRLHAQACRLAETKPKILSHPEVARAIERDLTFALVTCLTQAKVIEQGTAHRRHSLVMVGLEEVLARNPDRPLRMAQLCELIGIREWTLQSCCAAFLGLGPTRYALRRRLKQVRVALRDGDADGTSIGELARGYGFTQLGRFARAYRETFGESPSATLQRASKPRVAGQ